MGIVCSLFDRTDASLPAGAWDSHVHVVNEEKFPLHPLHPYRPKTADVADLLRFQASQGIAHNCLVAISVYHTDNRCLVGALRELKGQARGVACIDADAVTDDELRELHDAGVRAVRINLRSRLQQLSTEEFNTLLKKNADRIRPYGWALQIYVALHQVQQVADVMPSLDGVPVIIDHIAHPDAKKGLVQKQAGYEAFMRLLESGQVWTKLSGTYRFEDLPGLEDYVVEILRRAPDRVVWASDWPHTGGVPHNPGGDRNAVQDYRKIDDRAWVVRCKKWCRKAGGGNGAELVRKIWVDNPRKLWQYDDDGPKGNVPEKL
ncbi:Amidohydrolase 2 [Niveomyces insectorum RCEF 264]|uniref:Amidohydrolase 2 n=1 Tax=Niveomyces insectorum RCEF 264 TaxID=1081102 RepID=A0A162KY92_9HYPO|nr:Amidohydrolase 2 [Niveomyces insectorum RCEF 264]